MRIEFLWGEAPFYARIKQIKFFSHVSEVTSWWLMQSLYFTGD